MPLTRAIMWFQSSGFGSRDVTFLSLFLILFAGSAPHLQATANSRIASICEDLREPWIRRVRSNWGRTTEVADATTLLGLQDGTKRHHVERLAHRMLRGVLLNPSAKVPSPPATGSRGRQGTTDQGLRKRKNWGPDVNYGSARTLPTYRLHRHRQKEVCRGPSLGFLGPYLGRCSTPVGRCQFLKVTGAEVGLKYTVQSRRRESG